LRHSAKNKSPRFVSIGFYQRKLVFFVLVFIMAVFGYQYVKNSSYRTDQLSTYSPAKSINQNIVVNVSADGKIAVNGADTGQTVDLINNEIRLPVVDNPGTYTGKVTVTLTLPPTVSEGVKPEILAIHGVGETNYYMRDSRTVVYEVSDVSSTAIITIVASIPPGAIKPETGTAIFSSISAVKGKAWVATGIILPIITLIVMFIIMFYQIRRQRIDIPQKETTQPPMAIPPAVVGALVNQKVSSREIAATLIDLAERGDIVILDRERGFAFGKGHFDNRLLTFEKLLLSKIFSEHLSSDRKEIERRVNNHFYSKKMSIVTAGIYALATRLGYFKADPRKSLAKYRLMGIMFFLIALAGFVASLLKFKDPQWIVFFWMGMMASALVISYIASRLPIRTVIGQEVLSNWFAFKKYLSNPEEFPYSEYNQEIFQKYLPYAVVLGCESAWARRFAKHNFTVPEWFLSDKVGLGLEEFCLSLFPIVSYVGRSLSAIREPGFE